MHVIYLVIVVKKIYKLKISLETAKLQSIVSNGLKCEWQMKQWWRWEMKLVLTSAALKPIDELGLFLLLLLMMKQSTSTFHMF